MGTHLQQLLQSLCWNSEWNYAVFWKLKHRARMVLTWEDAYYNNHSKHDSSESKSFSDTLETLPDGHCAHDPLGLAVAKMSYRVYSLGEGIVGQVAVTGKHRWIFAGDLPMNSCPSPELFDGWQAQFSAGIKTIVVAAVVPHGVVQLGSLNKVNEDLKLLTHIRDAFSSLQDSAACHVQNAIQCSVQSIVQMSDTSRRTLGPDVLQEYIPDLDKSINKDHKCATSPVVPSPQKHSNDTYGASLPGNRIHLTEAGGFPSENGLSEAIDNAKLDQSVLGKDQSAELLNDSKFQSHSCKTDNAGTNAAQQASSSTQSCLTDNSSFFDVKLSAKKSTPRFKYSLVDHFESTACNRSVFDGKDHPSEEKINKLVPSDSLLIQKVVNNAEIHPELSCLEALDNLKSSFMFSAGSELHEALGPAFQKQCYHSAWELEKPEDRSTSHVPDIMESSMLTSDSGTDHLLEAVVAKFCRNDATVKNAVSFSTSESMLTTEKMPEPSINTSRTMGSSSYSIGCSSLLEESTQNCLNSSDSCSFRSSTSACREPLVRSNEPGKPNKKRARPGENSRPRPRDRQLIQDRIKELRDLVPNGSKCSIDSLLERTIKHMVFLQSVTKHADKLSSCAKSRGCRNETGVPGSGYEQGSSWAVEVGGHMKICPIVVENLNMNGQMLIEMLCEDSDHFLEIAEAIRSLGLTILKGVTDNHGDKTWMRFVVEGQSNRNLHRMDVLWSLVQILQSKTTA